MDFTPMNETDYKMRNVWPAGWYAATVCTTEDAVVEKTSVAGNQYFSTQIDVFNDNGAFKRITANIIATGKAEWQLREASEALGLLNDYLAGSITAEMLKGKSCWVKLAIKEDETGQYDPKNEIRNYRKDGPRGKAMPVRAAEPTRADVTMADMDDGIPF